MSYLALRKRQSHPQRRNGFTATELLVGVAAGTMILGASATALRSTQTIISESQERATLRQNTTNGMKLMRSEIERSMNVLITRTEAIQPGEEDKDLMSNHATVVNQCKEMAGVQGFNPLFAVNMVELNEPVIYGVGVSRSLISADGISLSTDGRGYALLRCGAPLNMDGTYADSEDADANNGDEQYQSGIFISHILDDIGVIQCNADDLPDTATCPDPKPLSEVLEGTSFAFSGDKTPARTAQQPALRIQTDQNTKLIKFIDPYELDDNKSAEYKKISASYLETSSGVKTQTRQNLYFAAFARADKRVRFGYNSAESAEGQGYPGGAFFQNITSENLRFILDGSGSMSACVAWSGEYGNTRRRFYDPQKGYFRTSQICSYTRMEALQNEMIDIIQNLPDATKIGLAAFSSDGYRNNTTWEQSHTNLVELGPVNSAERQSAIDFVLSLSNSDPRYWGGTMPWNTLNKAFEDDSTDTIYFLSDGKPNYDPSRSSWNSSDYEDVADYYAGLNANRISNQKESIKINSTSVGLDSEWMQLLSSRTSGEYIKVDGL